MWKGFEEFFKTDDIRGEDGPKVRAGGRRPKEARAGRIADQLFQKAPQAPGRGQASATPCALFAEIGRKSASQQSKSKNPGTERVRRERLTPPEVIGYTRSEAASPLDFDIDRDIPGRF